MTTLAERYEDVFLSPLHHVIVPVASLSGDEGPHYQHEHHLLDQRLIREYGMVGHPAVHCLHQTLDTEEHVFLYLAADIMLVTPCGTG